MLLWRWSQLTTTLSKPVVPVSKRAPRDLSPAPCAAHAVRFQPESLVLVSGSVEPPLALPLANVAVVPPTSDATPEPTLATSDPVLDDASDGTELKFHWVTVTACAGTATAANAAATTRCLIMEVSLDGEGQASREPADHRR